MLGLAGDGAGVTADALSKIDGEPVVGHAGFGIYHAYVTDNEPQSHRDTESNAVAPPTGGAGRRGQREYRQKHENCEDVSYLCFLTIPSSSTPLRGVVRRVIQTNLAMNALL